MDYASNACCMPYSRCHPQFNRSLSSMTRKRRAITQGCPLCLPSFAIVSQSVTMSVVLLARMTCTRGETYVYIRIGEAHVLNMEPINEWTYKGRSALVFSSPTFWGFESNYDRTKGNPHPNHIALGGISGEPTKWRLGWGTLTASVLDHRSLYEGPDPVVREWISVMSTNSVVRVVAGFADWETWN